MNFPLWFRPRLIDSLKGYSGEKFVPDLV